MVLKIMYYTLQKIDFLSKHRSLVLFEQLKDEKHLENVQLSEAIQLSKIQV